MTVAREQAIAAGMTHTVFHDTRNGDCSKTHQERWRSNGRCKTWSTRPDEFRLPIKFGLRGYGYLTNDNAIHFHLEDECPLLAEATESAEGVSLDDLVKAANEVEAHTWRPIW